MVRHHSEYECVENKGVIEYTPNKWVLETV